MPVILCANDNVLWLSGARNDVTGEYLTAGIVGLTGLYDSAGALVTGQAWPAAMSYIELAPVVTVGGVGTVISIVQRGSITARVLMLPAVGGEPAVARRH